jgi:hypothetical protein
MISHSPEIDKIAVAMVAMQHTPIIIGKDTAAYKYKYATLDKCVERIFPVLATKGLSILQPLSDINGEPAIATIIMHISGQFISTLFPLSKAGMAGVNAAQDFGAAIQYARRYGLLAAFAIPTGEDDDAQSLNKPKPAKKPAGKKYKKDDPTPADSIINGLGNLVNEVELNEYYEEHKQTIMASPKKDQILSEFSIRKGEMGLKG